MLLGTPAGGLVSWIVGRELLVQGLWIHRSVQVGTITILLPPHGLYRESYSLSSLDVFLSFSIK